MRLELSATGRQMLAFQKQLAEECGYAPIGYNLFLGDVRQKYLDALPEWCQMSGDTIPCYTLCGTLIATGYNRIVIGDYGAFVEFTPEQIVNSAIRVKPGQEYRIDSEQFCNRVKYHWLTAKDGSDVKIYYRSGKICG